MTQTADGDEAAQRRRGARSWRDRSAPAHRRRPAAPPRRRRTPRGPAGGARGRRPRRFPISPARRPSSASAGGAAAQGRAPPAQAAAAAATRDRGRHVAAAHAPRLDGPRVGRVLGGVGRRAGRDRPLHVPQRAQRAAAAVQGRLPERVRHGRRRALEGEVRRLDRPDAGRHRAATRAASTRCSSPARIWAARRTTCRPKASSSARATAAASARPASTSRARRRGRSSARASCWPTTARSWSTRPQVPVRAGAVDRSGGVSEGVNSGSSGMSGLRNCERS